MVAHSLIELVDITKTYVMGGEPHTVLAIPALTIEKREWVSITGQSGSGKTTLLHILGGLDRPTTGRYLLEGRDIATLTSAQLASVRAATIGFIFQRFNLLPSLTAAENIVLPLRYAGMPNAEIKKRLDEMLAIVGLSHRKDHYPHQLSGGQQQRIAIARALITNPPLVLADEPTGSLDSATGQDILLFLEKLHAERPITIVLITHDSEVAAHGTRQLHIRDGRIV